MVKKTEAKEDYMLILNYSYFYKPNIALIVTPAKNIFSTSFHVSALNTSGIAIRDEADVLPDIPFELKLDNRTLKLIITKNEDKWWIKQAD